MKQINETSYHQRNQTDGDKLNKIRKGKIKKQILRRKTTNQRKRAEDSETVSEKIKQEKGTMTKKNKKNYLPWI